MGNERISALVQRLLDGDPSESCLCVTHSNLIRMLMMRYGAVGGRAERDPATEGFTEGGEEEWHQLDCASDTLQQTKTKKLQNCGMLGVRFKRASQGDWEATDICLMFDSVLEGDQKTDDD